MVVQRLQLSDPDPVCLYTTSCYSVYRQLVFFMEEYKCTQYCRAARHSIDHSCVPPPPSLSHVSTLTTFYLSLSHYRVTESHHQLHQMRTRSQTAAALGRQPLLPSVTPSTSAPVRGSSLSGSVGVGGVGGGKTSSHFQAASMAPILPSPPSHFSMSSGSRHGIPHVVGGGGNHRVPVVPALTSLTRPPLHHTQHPRT